MHNVTSANRYGVVVYDWSNAKNIWANAHPMTSEELITAQAEAVYAADPGVPGGMPRVWAYR
jgi:SPP1 family predicted phage head-tail adaptor